MKPNKRKMLAVIRENSNFLKNEYGVNRIMLFGSVAKGTARSGSDIDLIVDLEKPLGLKFMEMADYLEKLLGYKVDIVTYKSYKNGARHPRFKHIAEDIGRSLIHVQP